MNFWLEKIRNRILWSKFTFEVGHGVTNTVRPVFYMAAAMFGVNLSESPDSVGFILLALVVGYVVMTYVMGYYWIKWDFLKAEQSYRNWENPEFVELLQSINDKIDKKFKI